MSRKLFEKQENIKGGIKNGLKWNNYNQKANSKRNLNSKIVTMTKVNIQFNQAATILRQQIMMKNLVKKYTPLGKKNNNIIFMILVQ